MGILGFLYLIARSGQNNDSNSQYQPASIKTDGEGIKRGLTAVEAAVLLDIDIEKIFCMILYGLVKKRAVVIESWTPFKVKKLEPLPVDLRDYEKTFLNALLIENGDMQKKSMQRVLSDLILSVERKMKGYSDSDTKNYYRSICKKAWKQVEKTDIPELRGQLIGDSFGWTMLEPESEKHLERTSKDREIIVPDWWEWFDPESRQKNTAKHTSSSALQMPSASRQEKTGSSVNAPREQTTPVLPGAMSIRSFTDSMRSFSRSVVGNKYDFRKEVQEMAHPTPVVQPSSTRSSRRYDSDHDSDYDSDSGSSSSCACACACDSCACACAGGGR